MKERMMPLLDIDEENIPAPETVEDEKKTAVRMAFLGCGQGGGNLASAFWDIGYRRVGVVNTTSRDMHHISIPESNRYVLKTGGGGAGKDPLLGRQAVEAESEEIFKLCQNVFKKEIEQVLICIGAGGGTGSGGALPLVKLCKEYLISIGVDHPEKKVGVIVTLPTKSESSAVQRNAIETILPLLELAEKGQLSPLVLVDNARVIQLYGTLSVVDVWQKANSNIAKLFDVFNILCAIDDESAHITCDSKDFKSVLASGVLAFGRAKLDKVERSTDIADAVRENVRKGLLVEGMDISKATAGLALLVSDQAGLKTVSQEALEAAFGSLNRLMAQSGETVLHRGVYEAGGPSVHLYTMISNMGRPVLRLREMETKAGSSYPIG
jgi:cell division GTPase FtsZ